jgi:hypothetical protein
LVVEAVKIYPYKPLFRSITFFTIKVLPMDSTISSGKSLSVVLVKAYIVR